MITATITLIRRDTGKVIDRETYRAASGERIVRQVLSGLRIEVNPYWPYGALLMSVETTHAETGAALWAIALVFGWVTPKLEHDSGEEE